jgi:hypothetical protein
MCCSGRGPGREDVVRRVIVVQRQPNLLEIVGALGAPGGLHRRQKEGDQDGNDRDDNQQLNQGKASTSRVQIRGMTSQKNGDESTRT